MGHENVRGGVQIGRIIIIIVYLFKSVHNENKTIPIEIRFLRSHFKLVKIWKIHGSSKQIQTVSSKRRYNAEKTCPISSDYRPNI